MDGLSYAADPAVKRVGALFANSKAPKAKNYLHHELFSQYRHFKFGSMFCTLIPTIFL
jgi:hypothetical protein